MGDVTLYGGSHSDIDSLMQNVYSVTDYIGMWLGICKYGVLQMRIGKESECIGITIESGE